MAKDKLAATIEAVGKKKAKQKKLKEAPAGTRASALPSDVRDALSAKFGKANLNGVRVHTGGNAAQLAGTLGARAFSVGNNIYLAKSGDARNRGLLAHELTHVLQQGRGSMPKASKGKALTSR